MKKKLIQLELDLREHAAVFDEDVNTQLESTEFAHILMCPNDGMVSTYTGTCPHCGTFLL